MLKNVIMKSSINLHSEYDQLNSLYKLEEKGNAELQFLGVSYQVDLVFGEIFVMFLRRRRGAQAQNKDQYKAKT